MKIKPLEKNENKLIKIKLVFLVSLIITGLIFSFFIKKPKPSEKDLPKKEGVLGSEKNPQRFNLSKIEDDISQIGKQILGETTNFINQTTSSVASEASNTISSLIYNTTIKPIINQIQHLPTDQQEKIKEEICK